MLNIKLLHDPEILFLGICQEENKIVLTRTCVQMLIAALFKASQKVEITHMSINGDWIKKMEQ